MAYPSLQYLTLKLELGNGSHNFLLMGSTYNLVKQTLLALWPTQHHLLVTELSCSRHGKETISEYASALGPENSTVDSVQHDCTSDPKYTDVVLAEEHTQHIDTVSPFRTRVGRVVKPVNRLIYTMSRQDIARNFQQNIQTACKSVIRALKS